VKIHGYRVELGEIEAVLAAHNLSRASAVLARDDDHGTKQLVAYLVPRDGHVANVEALRKALRTSLPEHMVPTRFVFLDALPLTPNGKVDREALAAYSTGTAGIGAGGPPRSDTEKTIAAIWKEVLQIEDVGIHDVFFDLGDSLNAIELVEQMDATFGTSLNLANLFDQSTIAALAEYVDALMLVAPESRPESQPESRPSTQTRVEEFDL
jgi:acyl carrier protein